MSIYNSLNDINFSYTNNKLYIPMILKAERIYNCEPFHCEKKNISNKIKRIFKNILN